LRSLEFKKKLREIKVYNYDDVAGSSKESEEYDKSWKYFAMVYHKTSSRPCVVHVHIKYLPVRRFEADAVSVDDFTPLLGKFEW